VIFHCCDERRRELVRDNGVVNGVDYNGIDFLEVLDHDATTQSDRQRKLIVHFLKPLAVALNKDNILIAGGERIKHIRVVSALPGAGPNANILTVTVDRPGDYSTYTLRVLRDALHATEDTGEPPAGFDPVLSSIEFSFKVECPSEFDCKPEHICPPEDTVEAEIDYLAKDYTSFRQVMLDRMSVLMPQWQERNAADLGIALVELLAYAADHLSYQQDVIATEAYLDTARRRVSVRRHALLVDYFMHDGSNARTWVQVQTDADDVKLPAHTQLLTQVEGLATVVDPPNDVMARQKIAVANPDRFETINEIRLFSAHNEIEFYTWSEERCCLPAGATSCTLKGELPNLKKGDVLIFVERLGPETGELADADPSHRHAVRLTNVKSSHDKLVTLDDHTTLQPVTEIEWHGEDALPFALCVSARTANDYEPKVSVALGNIALADHGRTIEKESLGIVPNAAPALATAGSRGGDRCDPQDAAPVPPRFTPRLKEAPLTQHAPDPFTDDASATSVFTWDKRDVLPDIGLKDTDGRGWQPQRDLLSSDAFAEEFVAEVEEDGRATLRFGDDEYGLRPTPGTTIAARYRIGNGTHGNIGADSLAHIVSADKSLAAVRNPLPAKGGTDPETIEQVRRSAPSAYRVQERAVTADDYAEVAQRHSEVQRAAATVRWTGSWRTIFLTVDRAGGRPVDPPFEQKLRLHLERYRMAGQDIEIDSPQFVSLEVAMTVCVKPGYFRSDVKSALLRVFGSSVAPDGTRGFFHPDNFSFGQPVYLSQLYETGQSVEGVRFVTIDTFQRLGIDSSRALDDAVLTIDRLEIARLDNDPNFPEHGVLRLTLEGGR